MQHGRDHDERLAKAERPRNQNVNTDEWDAELEADLAASGRGDLRPAEGLVGPHHRRAEHSTEGTLNEGDLPPPEGSDYAPTAIATRRERERHRLEREKGRVAAGTAGFIRDMRDEKVSREDLVEAAREADRSVASREMRSAAGDKKKEDQARPTEEEARPHH